MSIKFRLLSASLRARRDDWLRARREAAYFARQIHTGATEGKTSSPDTLRLFDSELRRIPTLRAAYRRDARLVAHLLYPHGVPQRSRGDR